MSFVITAPQKDQQLIPPTVPALGEKGEIASHYSLRATGELATGIDGHTPRSSPAGTPTNTATAITEAHKGKAAVDPHGSETKTSFPGNVPVLRHEPVYTAKYDIVSYRQCT